MRRFQLGLLIVSLAAAVAGAAEGDRHYLYLTSPDGAQGGGSGAGILVFDMDGGHRFVRRISIPSLNDGVRGVCASAATKRLYVTTSQKRLVCLDLLTDKVFWEKTYAAGGDRLAITPDGKTLYIPGGFWDNNTKGWMVIDAADGKELSRIATPAAGHNTVISLDGRRAYLASNSWLSIVDTATQTVLREVQTESRNFYPLTVNSDRSRVYACLGQEVGFKIIDAESGAIVGTVYPDGERIKLRTHGIGLSPDEREIWLAEQGGNDIYIFDNTQNPPKQKDKLTVSQGGHGWVSFSIDGKFAYTSSVEVFDAKEKKVLAILKDERDKPVCSSKTLEIVFNGNDVVAAGDQFGVGRLHAPKAR